MQLRSEQLESHLGRSLGPIWPYVVGGCAIVGILAGFLMWLAFYSANHGYDEPYDPDEFDH